MDDDFKFENLSRTEKLLLIKHGDEPDLDIFVKDKDWFVRQAVAEYGGHKYLDILVHDDVPEVRLMVAKRGRNKDLDILVHDKNIQVLLEVIRRGRHSDLNILLHHRNGKVHDEALKAYKDSECGDEHDYADFAMIDPAYHANDHRVYGMDMLTDYASLDDLNKAFNKWVKSHPDNEIIGANPFKERKISENGIHYIYGLIFVYEVNS